MFKIRAFRVVSMSLATAVWARPWCASPQPTRPEAVVTLTTTASRFTAVPMPSATRFSLAIGNDSGKALSSAIFIEQRFVARIGGGERIARRQAMLRDQLRKQAASGNAPAFFIEDASRERIVKT